MALSPVENLKGFVSSRPPLMIFVMCLGMFAIVLMTLGYYVKLTEVTNPDESQDWNVFLESFSDLHFCILNNNTDVSQPTTVRPAKPAKDYTTTKADHSTVAFDTMRNYSVSMLLTVHPTKEFLSIPHNLTRLNGAIRAGDLGLIDDTHEHELINIMMELPFEWNRTKCSRSGQCDPVQFYACINLQGPSGVFPESRSPQTCESMNDTGVEYHARLHVERPHPVAPSSTLSCHLRPMIRLKHSLDPTLTVWLSLHDRSVVNLHLLHTSYFLFVMVVTLLCYAVIRGHHGHGYKPKMQAPDKVPFHT